MLGEEGGCLKSVRMCDEEGRGVDGVSGCGDDDERWCEDVQEKAIQKL